MLGAEAVKVELANLEGTFSPRQHLDEAHVRVLAESVDQLPPILVHGATRRIIDGMHRVAAHELARRTAIEAEVFHGTDAEAAVEAVQRNVAHGLPLRLEDRKAAARAILIAQSKWSDRRVAMICGLSPKTVGAIRAASEEIPQSSERVGRDGRSRAVASPRLPCSPIASALSHIGAAGAGVTTGPEVDAALASATGGSALLEWLQRTDPSGWESLSEVVPLSRVYELASLARQRAAVWQQFARSLEDRPAR